MTNHSPYRTADPLGSVVSEHPVAGVQQGVRIALGLFSLLIAVDCVWLGMWPRFGEIHWGAFFVTGIIALVFFWLAFDAFSEFVKARRKRVICHEHGIRIHDLNRHDDVRYDDIRTVGGMLWQVPEGQTPAGAVLWVDDVQGRRIELPSPMRRANDVGQTIRSMTFENRRSEVETRLSRGESVRFGRIELGSLVLVVDRELIPRSIVEPVKLSTRWLSIRAHGQRERLIPIEEIPNADVLLSVLS